MRPRAALLAFVISVLVLPLVLPAGATAAPNKHRGLDVSQHQGKILWRKVPPRQRFVFVKATEGATHTDPYYKRNRRLAKRNGKLVGAYHFGYPQGGNKRSARRDARGEARYFARVAKPRKGELRPVLDIEISNGLPPRRLKPWAKAFVKALRKRAQGKPMIYTSPYFWRTAMDNTKWFAKRGYKALWIAHWDTKRPDVPAGNWDGRGWTFWQFTDCGKAKGISGCVDKNRYRYRGFKRVKIGR